MKKKILYPALALILLLSTVSFKSDFFEIAKQIEIFTTMFKELNMNYVDETNPAELMDTAIKAMLDDLDPYTKYWNEQDVEASKIRNAGEYTGIGASVKTVKDKIIIVEPYKDYPADKAGLKAGDKIIKIGDVVVSDFEEDAGELLKGASGTEVEITYKRQNQTKNTILTREEIEVKAVPFSTLLDDNTGYIVLSKFNNKASLETIAALKDLKAKGADKIILDLRGNPGGLLSEAINVTNIFVPKGELITTTKSVVKKYNKEYFTKKTPIDTDIPLVVLVNGRSASASEIVAGSIQDLDRGVVIGARSFGKGLVQRPKKLTYGTQLKITISRYYTPSGRCIQALDYWNRDENNKAVRINEQDFKAFKTKNGRTVYDGGGIQPDIELETSKFSNITTSLLQSDAIFDYGTKYYYSHQNMDINNFKLTDKDYEDFKIFVKQSGFNYETETEKSLRKSLQVAKKDKLDADISDSYNALIATIKVSKEKGLDTYKTEIQNLLTDEIVKRYAYREGLYDYYISHNPEIQKSKEILSNKNKYEKILK
ncbi:carboxyl-terminal processing protease [Aquimarina amphilecti]|uniref:Carboxyl-terminal processing protease n=1 Tax=Aquimarina amphilecti TaxID=1038014 RepID=A0A1H7JZ99_AQUAM|nr:S41 family peptidase [Aquimarina amphilecti]SEK79470.1 carboxyl-terminal processing protease [Aquimarina amphilecti]